VTALAAVLWVLLSCGSVSADDADSPKTSSSIKQALVEAYAKRQGLSLEYRLTSSAMGAVPAGQYIRRVIAADRRGQFFLDNSHGHDAMAFTDDPYRRMTFVCPTRIEILRCLDRIIRKYPPPVPASLLRSLPGELVLLLGWWPFADAPELEMLGRKRSIEALKNDASFILRPQAQVVDGYSCHVIEIPKVDSIWVDTTNAYVVRRREFFDHETGALAFLVEYRDYRAISTDVQVPVSIRISEFDYAAQFAPDRDRCINRLDFRILNAQSNEHVDIPALTAAFRLPGTMQMTLRYEDEKLLQDEYELIAEGEEDHARSIVLWGRKQLDSAGDRPDSDPLRLLRPSLLSLSAGLAAGCLVLVVRSYFRTRSSGGASPRKVHPD
jgi:hypothetical protein